MIFQGWLVRLFQPEPQGSMMPAQDLKTRWPSQLPRRNCQMVLTGLSSGERGK